MLLFFIKEIYIKLVFTPDCNYSEWSPQWISAKGKIVTMFLSKDFPRVQSIRKFWLILSWLDLPQGKNIPLVPFTGKNHTLPSMINPHWIQSCLVIFARNIKLGGWTFFNIYNQTCRLNIVLHPYQMTLTSEENTYNLFMERCIRQSGQKVNDKMAKK